MKAFGLRGLVQIMLCSYVASLPTEPAEVAPEPIPTDAAPPADDVFVPEDANIDAKPQNPMKIQGYWDNDCTQYAWEYEFTQTDSGCYSYYVPNVWSANIAWATVVHTVDICEFYSEPNCKGKSYKLRVDWSKTPDNCYQGNGAPIMSFDCYEYA
ncbi:hypothetical protein BGZ63DRAFT_403294 [Mariannaea sp. PMI_226]|nr:hypothetical protein BGZ63DRAFT_403294 [Mariannaea sp. PMI_226]